MSRIACIALMCLAASSFADQASPAPTARGRAAWIGQCAARMEKARGEAAKRDPGFLNGSVEATSREAAQPGDPTATVAYDQVEYRFVISKPGISVHDKATQELFSATVSTAPGDNSLIRETWGSVSTPAGTTLYQARSVRGLTGTLVVTGASGPRPRTFDAAFRKAVDDCLAMKKGGSVGKGGGN